MTTIEDEIREMAQTLLEEEEIIIEDGILKCAKCGSKDFILENPATLVRMKETSEGWIQVGVSEPEGVWDQYLVCSNCRFRGIEGNE